jgi:multiple sugar transport system ATP-binding protein
MAGVTLTEVVKTYGDVVAVDHVNLDIQDGEFVALVGPSGCGKTTTLNLIAGLIELTSGEIMLGDRQINTLDPKDRDLAMVFQNYALYPNKTVFENLAFPLRMRKTPKASIDEQVKRTANVLSIEHLLDRHPRQLSGGQQQRVALGRALVRNATVFLMDEPLSNLDALLRVNTRTEIKRLQRELGKTTIFVTHDQEEAMVLSDKIAIMRDGVLQQYSTPDETYNAPVNTFVAGFIGSPRMNFLKGTLHNTDGRTVLDTGGFQMALPGDAARAIAASHPAEVTVGIRPEHLALAPANDGDLTARVELIEPVGPVTYLDVMTGDRALRASVPGNRRYEIGSAVGLTVDPESLHFFDAAGNRIAA